MLKRVKQFGTTLLEIEIYFAIVAVALLFGMTFLIQIFNASQISSNFHELQSNINFISNKLLHTIQNASSIDDDNSNFNNLNGELTLNMSNAALSPTSFYLNQNNLLMSEGSGADVQLNSELVKINSFQIHKVTYNKAPDHIIIDIEIAPLNSDIEQYSKVRSVHLSASLKNL